MKTRRYDFRLLTVRFGVMMWSIGFREQIDSDRGDHRI